MQYLQKVFFCVCVWLAVYGVLLFVNKTSSHFLFGFVYIICLGEQKNYIYIYTVLKMTAAAAAQIMYILVVF